MITPLDRAHAAMLQGGAAEGLAFYRALADAELYLLLKTDAVGDTLHPEVFDLAAGPVILAFDLDERLASFSPGVQPYAVLPGRVIAQEIAGHGIALGLNFGSGAPSETILPPEAMDWLLTVLDVADPLAFEARLAGFVPPQVPERVAEALTRSLAEVELALLIGVRYHSGKAAELLVLIGVPAAAEPKFGRAVTEALAFSGLDAAALDLLFLPKDHALLPQMAGLALMLQRSAPPHAPEPAVSAQAKASRPPRLR